MLLGFGTSLPNFAARLEAWCMAGIEGKLFYII